jgi:hypothetical protein
MSSRRSVRSDRVFKNPDEQEFIPIGHFLQVNACNSRKKQVSAYITPERLGQGLPQNSTARQPGLFH